MKNRYLDNFRFYSKQKMAAVRKDIIRRLSKNSSIVAVFDFGSPSYANGLSDIDLIIVVNILKESNNKMLQNTLQEVLEKYDYLTHPFKIIPLRLFRKIIDNQIFPYGIFFSENNYISDMHEFRKIFHLLYAKNIFHKPDGRIRIIPEQELYNNVEYFLYQKFYFLQNYHAHQSIPMNCREFLKRLKITMVSINRLTYILNKLHNPKICNATDQMNTLTYKVASVIKQVPLLNNKNYCIVSSYFNQLRNGLIHLFPFISDSLIEQFNSNSSTRAKVVTSEFGKIIFLKNYYKYNYSFIARLCGSLGWISEDITIYHYIEKYKYPNQDESREFKKRLLLQKQWIHDLNKNNLRNYSSAPYVLSILETIREQKHIDTLLTIPFSAVIYILEKIHKDKIV